MADDPRWSVLLPTHHAPETLGFSIDSVLTQTDGDLELLLVGDGVTDETRALVARYSDERIRFFDRPKGPGFGYASRAEALETARGRFVAFASDDDLWAPDHLARLGGFLDSGAAIAHSRSFWCRPDGLLVPVPFDAADPANRERFEAENFVPSSCSGRLPPGAAVGGRLADGVHGDRGLGAVAANHGSNGCGGRGDRTGHHAALPRHATRPGSRGRRRHGRGRHIA